MPIKTLESYLFERKLAQTSSIEILKHSVIGIDVEHYLSRIYTYKKEQFLLGIGGIPSSLKDYILSDLKVFKEFNIKPIFVISGLNIQLQLPEPSSELSPQEQHIELTWSKIDNKSQYSFNNIESFRLFTDPLPLKPMVQDLVKYFIELDIDYMICPYDASFQLSYLYQNELIDSIYGSTDLLLTKIDKFILGMEFQSKDFRFVDKLKVLQELAITERQLIDISLIVGCNLQPTTFPNLPNLLNSKSIPPQINLFKLALDILYQFGLNNDGLLGYIISLQDPRLLQLYFKGHCAIKYIPVLNKQGYAELYNVEMNKLGIELNVDYLNDEETVVKIPNDIHDIISQRLPPEFYYYMSIGLLPINLLQAIVTGGYSVRPPLEIKLGDSFKKLINLKFYTEKLNFQFNLLTQLLARYYQVKKINLKFWYNQEVIDLNTRLNPPISKRVNNLFSIHSSDDNSGQDFSLINLFTKLDGDYKNNTSEIKSNDDIVSTIMVRTLYLFDIIDNNTYQLKTTGKILQKYLELHGKELVDDSELEQLILILLLIQSKTLKLTELNKEFSNVSKLFKDFSLQDSPVANTELNEKEQSQICLISRIFSLKKFQISPINYQGPISRNLLHFKSHVKFINQQLNQTIQCLLVDFIVHQQQNNIKATYGFKNDWYKLINNIPFYNNLCSTLLGIVANIYFEYSLRQTKRSDTITKQEIISNTQDHLFNHVYQINAPSFNINVNGVNSITSNQLLSDFAAGVKFWNQFINLVKVVNELDKGLISDEYYKEIIEADELLNKVV
ncbi:Protein MKT1 [Spathaspora sp. JA1]|nr:Protein MKT1 [Spathaspora sp. JA1]